MAIASKHLVDMAYNAPPEMYMPMTQAPLGAWPAYQRSLIIIARSGGRAPIAGAMRNAVRRIDPAVPLFDIRTMPDVVQEAAATDLGDGGLLFALAVIVFVASALVVWLRRRELPVIGARLAMPGGAR